MRDKGAHKLDARSRQSLQQDERQTLPQDSTSSTHAACLLLLLRYVVQRFALAFVAFKSLIGRDLGSCATTETWEQPSLSSGMSDAPGTRYE